MITIVKKVTHIQLGSITKIYYEKKTPLFVYGAFGIGKSFAIRDTAIEIAEQKKKIFLEWNKVSKDKKKEVFANPTKYFVFIDERLSEYDSSDIKGLPKFNDDSDTLDWRIPQWAKYLTIPGSDGVVFFDEINLATPLVISSVYKIIYDRIIGDGAIAKDWFMIGAGNRDNDHAYIHSLPAPVRDRGGEVELTAPSVDDWTAWASANKIDTRIIAYVNFKQSSLYSVNHDDGQKFTTTRGYERLSHLTNGLSGTDFELVCKTAIGEGIASEYIAFCNLQGKIDLDKIIANPKLIEKITKVDENYLLVSGVTGRYGSGKIPFDKLIDVMSALDEYNKPEFATLLFRMGFYSEKKKFQKEFLSSKNKKGAELFKKYYDYIAK